MLLHPLRNLAAKNQPKYLCSANLSKHLSLENLSNQILNTRKVQKGWSDQVYPDNSWYALQEMIRTLFISSLPS